MRQSEQISHAPQNIEPADPDRVKQDAIAQATYDGLLAKAAKLQPNKYFYAEISNKAFSSWRLHDLTFVLQLRGFHIACREGYRLGTSSGDRYIPHRIAVGRVDDIRHNPTKIARFLENVLNSEGEKESE